MTELEQNLRLIKNEKDTKILPENIKEGVQIFDVIGTYRGTYDGSISEEEYQEDLDLANDILGID